MTTKLLSARQARWAEILSRYHFKISYKTGASNKAAPLTRIEGAKDLNHAKHDNREQVLLLPQNLDDRIVRDVEVNRLSLSLPPIAEQLDLIDDVLRTNRNAPDLARARKLGQDRKGGYYIKNGLLKKKGKLVVT